MNDQTTTRRAVIVTAIGLEYSAVRSHLTNITESTHHGTIYETGTFATSASTWHVTILETGMGNTNAAVETERAIGQHHPDIVLFVGIAGGLKDAKIGDVIAATHVYGYESGKQAEEFLVRPNVGTASYDLVQRARAEARKTTWHTLRTPPPNDLPRVLIGPIAAGEKVLTSSTAPLRNFLHKHYNDALAIEMEGRGFLAATYANTQTKSIVIRGISDLLDNKSVTDEAGNQALAAEHASVFAYHLLATLHPAALELSNLTPEQYASITSHREVTARNTTPLSPVERDALTTLLPHVAFHERVLRLIDAISQVPHHFVTNIARPLGYTPAVNALRSTFNKEYDEFRSAMRIGREMLAALNQTTTAGTAARQRLLDAISKVEDTVERLVQTSHEVYGIQHALPRDQAREASTRLSVFITRRLTHQPARDGTKTLVFLSRGGTCRDPMAKVIFDQFLDTMTPRPEITVLAAGIGPIRDAHASFAARHAINALYGKDLLKDHVPTLLTPELTEQADVILAMDHTLLGKTLPKGKTYLLTEFLGGHGDITDPYPDGKDAATLDRYRSCAEQLRTVFVRNMDRVLDALSI
jgi:nucleoside phosphorylase/protein-tyrosine-phosphatase